MKWKDISLFHSFWSRSQILVHQDTAFGIFSSSYWVYFNLITLYFQIVANVSKATKKKPNLLIPAQPFSIHSMRTEMIIQNVVDWLGLLMKLILIVFSTEPRRNPETMISRSRSPHCTSSKNNSGHKHHEGKSSGGGAETSYTNSRKSKEWA